MQALILAGGRGTRLRPLTVYTPKPIVPIVNRPLLMYQIDLLSRAGITDITLSLSYQPDKIQQVVGDGSELGVKLRYVTEPSPMGTGGAYRLASDAANETTIVMNGDILTDLDINSIVKFHASHRSDATIALIPVEDPELYGVAQVNEDGRILRFTEKPGVDQISKANATVNAGIYVLEPSILKLIAKDSNRSFEYHVFPEILERNLPFFGYTMSDDYWLDVGTPERYLQANLDLLSGALKGIRGLATFPVSDVATHAEIDRLTMIGEDCTIKPGARISNSVIGPGVHIEEKAVIKNSVIWPHTRIASFAEVRGSIIGRGCHVGRNAVVGDGSVLGDKTSLTDYTRV